MKTIFIIILALLGGLLFGLLLVRFFIFVSNYFLGRKTRKEILKKGLPLEEIKRRNFFFRNKAYNLAEQVEYDLKKKNSFSFKNIFKKKGVSDYGRTNDNAGPRREQVSTTSEGVTTPSPTDSATNTATATGEQPNTDTTETRGQ